MPRGPYLLGIDLGTGSTKAVLLDEAGTEQRVVAVPVSLARPRPGWVESSPEDWWGSVTTAVRQVIGDDGARVAAIGLSGQMHGIVLTGGDGQALRPAMLWLDRRAGTSAAAYRAVPAGDRKVLGNPFVPGMAGPMLHWLVANEPAVVNAAAWALQPKDWLRMRLVGQAGSEPSDASGTLLFDVLANQWAATVVEDLGLPGRLLAPLGPSAAAAGPLEAGAAAQLGLPSGVPVAFGAADTAAALVGTGLAQVGAVQLTVGSAAQAVALREAPAPDPALRYHVFSSARPGTWYALAAVQASGIALSWALEVLGASWEEAYAALDRSPVGANGVVFVPHVAGARSPSMNYAAQAGLLHLELRHQRPDLLRAVLEGVAFSIVDAISCLPEFPPTNDLYLAGGGSLHPVWRRLLCDLAGRRLLVVENPNASARGAALLGAQAAGLAHETAGLPPVMATVEPEAKAHAELIEALAQWRAAS